MLAIVVTLGGYFAGLHWLISPPDPWQPNPKLSLSTSQQSAARKRLPPAVRPIEAAVTPEAAASTGPDIDLASVETSAPVRASEPASGVTSETGTGPPKAQKLAAAAAPIGEPAHIVRRESAPAKTKAGNRKRVERSANRKLELMVLRTYERSDGKRFTRLLPMSNALAFQSESQW